MIKRQEGDIRRISVLLVLPLGFCLGCEGAASNSGASPQRDARSAVALIATAPVGKDFAVVDSKDPEAVLFAAPYVLGSNRAQVSVPLSESDWQRLIDANVSQENVMIAVLRKNSVGDIGYLGPQFSVSPGVWLCTPGATARITEADGERRLVVGPSPR